jgi:DNA-nicking Smr family endonuclease
MSERKDSESFEELIGQVDDLAPGPKRGPPSWGDPRRIVVNSSSKAQMTVEREADLVVGYAADGTIQAARALAGGPLPPVRQLDLHRLGAAQAKVALAHALRQARADGVRTLVVICGRGHHSGPGGPVLPNLVIDELSGPLSDGVLAFRSAPLPFGGSGALLVRIRRR